jgi:amidase
MEPQSARRQGAYRSTCGRLDRPASKTRYLVELECPRETLHIALRAWQIGSALLPLYKDPARRSLLSPEAIFEVETGIKLAAYDVMAASTARSEWSRALRRLFERHDYLVVPTAQTFPFDLNMRWPQEIAGRKMETYHEWMKANCLISMSGLPALAAPAGFGLEGLPIGLQIVAPNRGELACLELAHAFERATDWTRARPPPLLSERQ